MNEPSTQASQPESIGSRYLRENIGPVLDYVANHRKPLVVTRHGRPAVKIVPADWPDPDEDAGETRSGDLPAHITR